MQGSELRNIRQRLRWTQAQLAGALGLTETYVGLMERGQNAIEKRTELAVQHLLADTERAELHENSEPITEAENILKALTSAKNAAMMYRKSGERFSEVAEPTFRLLALHLAHELSGILLDIEESEVGGSA